MNGAKYFNVFYVRVSEIITNDKAATFLELKLSENTLRYKLARNILMPIINKNQENRKTRQKRYFFLNKKD